MDLNIYDVIVRPRATSKVYRLNQTLQQIVLEVHPQANKPMIKEALKKLFNVDADKIRTVTMQGKVRRAGRYEFLGKKRKKAIITLKKGQASQLAGLAPGAESMPESAAS
jgi:large subunit ribosomal protein L23